MRNKLLLVTHNAEYKSCFEEMLAPLLEQGCELFFTDSKERGLEIVAQEHPQLIFIDAATVQEFPTQEKSSLFWIRPEGYCPKEGEEVLFAPFSFTQLFQKIDPFLSFTTAETPPL